MTRVKHWMALAAPAAMILQTSEVVGRDAMAQAPDRLPRVAQALLLFEGNVRWAAVSDKWRGRRDGWIGEVKSAASPADLAKTVVELETAMGWGAVQDSWRRRRESWIEDMKTADTAGDVATGLLELESETRWSAVSNDWRQLRDPWVRRLKAIE
jgi:hypothetical protein